MAKVIFNTIFKYYRFHLLVALVFAIAVVSFRLETNILNIVLILFGSLVGALLMEVDYYFFIYLTDPEHHFSKMVKSLLEEKKYSGAIAYINSSRGEIERTVLHSVLFQPILLVLAFYVNSSSASLFAGAMTLTMLLHTFIDQAREYAATKKVESWFWPLRFPVTEKFLAGYFAVMVIGFLYIFRFLL